MSGVSGVDYQDLMHGRRFRLLYIYVCVFMYICVV